MRKSLYKKFYLAIFLVVPLIFLVFGGIVTAFSGDYWLKQNQQLLGSQAQTVAQQMERAAQMWQGPQFYAYTDQVADLLYSSTGTYILVTDMNGNPLAGAGKWNDTRSLPPSFLQPNGDTDTFNGTMSGLLREPCTVVAQPVTVNRRPAFMVYAAIPKEQTTRYTWNLVKIIGVAMGVTMVVLAFAAYFVVAALVRPLTQMSHAAKRLAQGDFSCRISVKRQDEIGQLATAFNQMTLSLEAGEKMRRGFVANVSHELKTPMTTIGGFVDGILDGTVPKERQNEYLAIVSQEVKRLSRLVTSMLNLSRLESGEVVVHPTCVNLTEQVLDAAFMLESAVNEKQLTLQGLEELPQLWLTADQGLIRQVVNNLLDNAVKYTPPQGVISLHGREEKGLVYLSVRNSGEGIPEEQLPFVFDRFYKVDQSRGTDKNSLGLGLYLTKTIVNLHGGSITVRSQQGSFCEFEVVFPSTQPTQLVER